MSIIGISIWIITNYVLVWKFKIPDVFTTLFLLDSFDLNCWNEKYLNSQKKSSRYLFILSTKESNITDTKNHKCELKKCFGFDFK